MCVVYEFMAYGITWHREIAAVNASVIILMGSRVLEGDNDVNLCPHSFFLSLLYVQRNMFHIFEIEIHSYTRSETLS